MFAQKAVIIRRGAILLVDEEGAWGLPGGRLESEDLDEGLRREVLEETGVSVDILPGVIDLWSFTLNGERVVAVSRRAIVSPLTHRSLIDMVSIIMPDHRWQWFSRESLATIRIVPDQMPSILAVYSSTEM